MSVSPTSLSPFPGPLPGWQAEGALTVKTGSLLWQSECASREAMLRAPGSAGLATLASSCLSFPWPVGTSLY